MSPRIIDTANLSFRTRPTTSNCINQSGKVLLDILGPKKLLSLGQDKTLAVQQMLLNGYDKSEAAEMEDFPLQD